MADSHEAINHVLAVEGGYVDHPSDPGGATKYGITQRTLDRYNGTYGQQAFPVRFLSPFQARQIYKELYWDKLDLDRCPNERFAAILFDQAVNQGPARAVKRAQEAINFTLRGVSLEVDGKMGPKTLTAMAQARLSTMVKFFEMSQTYYLNLVEARPKLGVFLKGWINRTHKMLGIILA